ncbi:MAG: FAD-binding oxidoreductase, partial [Gammaproteobacteria bacterium]|nr:FAD-binding oxidoreductase [Gammaproteobacteria bacterium]
MIAEQLAELVGAEQITVDADLLAAYRFDRWCLKHWQDWQGHALDTPACVVRPRDSKDVQAVVRYASERRIAIVPWGLGSGVCGGIEPDQGQILVDMSAMDRIVSIDDENLLLTVEAGV